MKPHVRCAVLLAALVATPAGAGGGHGHDPGAAAPCADAAAPATIDCGLAPSVAFDAAGRLWAAWTRGGHVYVNHSSDHGASFTAPVAVNATPEAVAADGENRPKIALGPDGAVHVSWTRRGQQRYTGDVRYSRSTDSGRTFSTPRTAHTDRRPISHRFETLAVAADGSVHLAWLDKRDRADAEADGAAYRGAALYHARVRDGVTVAERRLIHHSCECCRVAMAMGPDDHAVILWRHVYPGHVRDHALMRVAPDGALSGPFRVSHDEWRIEACPHHGPAVDVGADGTVHAAWFDNAAARHGLFYARSTTGGAGFGAPISFGRYARQAAHPHVLAAGGRVFLAWTELEERGVGLWVRRSADGGVTWSPARRLAGSTGTADHAFLVRDGARVFVSWHSRPEGYRLLPVAEEEGP